MAHTIEERKCPLCGKNFCHAPYHLYSCGEEKRVLLCSWTCMLRYEEKEEARKSANMAKRRKKKE